MVVKEITVGKTFNTGNYTSVRFDITVSIEQDDNIEDKVKKLSDDIDFWFQQKITKPAGAGAK